MAVTKREAVKKARLIQSSLIREHQQIMAAAPNPVVQPAMSEIVASIETLNKVFAEFKSANDNHLLELKKGIDDVVAREKVDRINSELSRIDAEVGKMNAAMAAIKIHGANDQGENAPEKVAYRKAFGSWVRRGAEAGLRDLEVKGAMRTDSDPDGGYTVPVEIDRTISRVLTAEVAMRRLANVMQIGTDRYVRYHNVAGTTSGWVGETETRPETNTPAFKEIVTEVHEIYANPASTQKQLDDSFLNVEQFLADEVNIAFAEKEGTAFISGSGVKQPMGFLSETPIANASYAWGSIGFVVTGAAADFHATTPGDNIVDMVYALKTGYRQNGVFLMNNETLSKIRKFKDTTNQYLWQPVYQAGQPGSLCGYGIEIDENMPAVGANTYPVAFADWKRGYRIVDRVGIRVTRDPFTNKPYVMFYTTKRVGGRVDDFAAIKLLKCST